MRLGVAVVAGLLRRWWRQLTSMRTALVLIIDRQGRVAVVLRKVVTRKELEPLVRQVAQERDSGG